MIILTLKNSIMSKATLEHTVSFQYGSTHSAPEPDHVITMNANGQSVQLEENSPAVTEPNISLFSLNFGNNFYQLYLYFDGQQFNVPQLAGDNTLMALVPLPAGRDHLFVVYNQSDPTLTGTAIINFTVSDNEIGVLIVGTGGLTDPKA
jgi:hypothetical protein